MNCIKNYRELLTLDSKANYILNQITFYQESKCAVHTGVQKGYFSRNVATVHRDGEGFRWFKYCLSGKRVLGSLLKALVGKKTMSSAKYFCPLLCSAIQLWERKMMWGK